MEFLHAEQHHLTTIPPKKVIIEVSCKMSLTFIFMSNFVLGLGTILLRNLGESFKISEKLNLGLIFENTISEGW